jgi:hypothetical protein
MGTGTDNAAASENGEEEEKAPRPSERNGEEEALGTWARHTPRQRSLSKSLLIGLFVVGPKIENLFLENLGHD